MNYPIAIGRYTSGVTKPNYNLRFVRISLYINDISSLQNTLTFTQFIQHAILAQIT